MRVRWYSNPRRADRCASITFRRCAIVRHAVAAVILWGGLYASYAISTNGIDPNLINFSAFVDGYGDTQWLTTLIGQDFKQQTGGDDHSGPPACSAFVFDHACGRHYCAPGGGESNYNNA